jgi:hypothetical protein
MEAQFTPEGAKDLPLQRAAMGFPGLDIPPEDKEKSKLVWKMLQQAKTFRSPRDRHWPRWWNLWESNHYTGRIVQTLSRAIVNQVFSSVETFVGHVVDILVPPECYARNPRHRRNAEILTKWLQTAWDTSGAKAEIEHCVRSAAVTGIGWAEVAWDETLSNHRGEATFDPKDERTMFVSPHARNLREALYVQEAKNVPREYVESAWELGAKVPPGVWDPTLSGQRGYAPGGQGMGYGEFTTTDGSQTGYAKYGDISSGKENAGLVTLIKSWIRQRDGKMRLLVVSNGIVLEDGANWENPSPYDDNDYPYVTFNLLPTLDSPYGRSLVQFVEGLQEIIDTSLSQLLDAQHYAADPMLVVNDVNAEQGNIIENMPGAVLFDQSPNGNGYQWLQGPGFNPAWLQVIEMVTSAMDAVLGRVDVLKGERPVGVNTLGGLEVIRDEANVRVRNLIRWVKASVKRSYLLIISRLRQFVKDQRTVRLLSEAGREEYIEVNPVVGNKPDGAPIIDVTIPEDAEFDVEFAKEEPGGEQSRREFVFQMMATPAEDGLPLATRAWALEKLKIEDAQKILEGIEKEKGSQAEMAQAQAAPAAGAPVDPSAEAAMQNPMAEIAALFQQPAA